MREDTQLDMKLISYSLQSEGYTDIQQAARRFPKIPFILSQNMEYSLKLPTSWAMKTNQRQSQTIIK
jgi:hypothetical protein